MNKITITLTVTFEQLDEITKILRDSPQARYYKRNKDEVNERRRAKLSTDSQSLPKQTAAAGSTSDKRWNRFVEFRNVDGQLCTQVASGTEASLDKQFINNKQYKPRWVSELLEQGMPTMQWQIDNEPSDKWVTDTTNSWRAV